MILKCAALLVLALVFGLPVRAHNLDEYLQAAVISIDKDQVRVSMRLLPGVAVLPRVMASIDTNSDGTLSTSEQQAYALRVLDDLTLGIDAVRVKPQLLSVEFPALDQMAVGLGDIRIEFTAALPPGHADRKLVLENHHQSAISAYLVNCLVPQDPAIRILTQRRNETQSFYELDYSLRGNGATDILSGPASMFRLGMHHIATGRDHLLFLLTLLLSAPLAARQGRWAGVRDLRGSLWQIVGVVTAFTIGHSVTLALAGLNLVSVPIQPIEVLIALSIFVSATHALRPLFPRREAVVAGFFGLIHGLAFAETLARLVVDRWERVVDLLGFNLGIEAMQLLVVLATMPSLLLLTRTRVFTPLRIGGALAAGLVSLVWIAERLPQPPWPWHAWWIGLLLLFAAHLGLRGTTRTA
jgi:hydrogenase/urease accessory protein HupE